MTAQHTGSCLTTMNIITWANVKTCAHAPLKMLICRQPCTCMPCKALMRLKHHHSLKRMRFQSCRYSCTQRGMRTQARMNTPACCSFHASKACFCKHCFHASNACTSTPHHTSVHAHASARTGVHLYKERCKGGSLNGLVGKQSRLMNLSPPRPARACA